MKPTSLLLTIPLLISMTVSGCSSSDGDSAGNISFTVIASGSNLDIQTVDTKLTETFQDQASLNLTATELNIDISGTNFDFNSSQVVLITMGVQFSGGHSIAATNAIELDSSVTLSVLLESPGVNCISTQALNHPFQLLEIETLKQINFEERSVTSDC